MNEYDAFGAAHEVERPVEGGVAAAADDDVLAFKDGGILAAVVKLRASNFSMPLTRSGRGWKEPTPAAMITTLVMKRVPVLVST